MLTLTVAGKGGSGKTTTAWHLGALLAGDRRVLLADMDPQGTLTNAVGIVEEPALTLADVLLRRAQLAGVIVDLSPTLAIAPAGADLSAAEGEIAKRYDAPHVLSKAIATVSDRYDVCIVDTAPALGMLGVNALAAARGVILTVIPEGAGLLGLKHFLAGIAEIREQVAPRLEIAGLLATFYSGRLTYHEAAIADIEQAGLPMFKARIGRSIRLAETVTEHRPITEYDPANDRAQEYRDFAREVSTWLENHAQP